MRGRRRNGPPQGLAAVYGADNTVGLRRVTAALGHIVKAAEETSSSAGAPAA